MSILSATNAASIIFNLAGSLSILLMAEEVEYREDTFFHSKEE
jgi:hypothetical protein